MLACPSLDQALDRGMREHEAQTSIFEWISDALLGSDAEKPNPRTTVELRPTSYCARTWLPWAPCQARGNDLANGVANSSCIMGPRHPESMGVNA